MAFRSRRLISSLSTISTAEGRAALSSDARKAAAGLPRTSKGVVVAVVVTSIHLSSESPKGLRVKQTEAKLFFIENRAVSAGRGLTGAIVELSHENHR